MLRNWIFWLSVVCVFVLCFIFGCKRNGRVGPTRTAACIVGGGDGSKHAWLAYEDAFGDTMDQPGLRMDRAVEGAYCEYIPPNESLRRLVVDASMTWIEGSGITGDGGRLFLTGYRNWQDAEYYIGYVFTAYARYEKPGLGAGCTRTAVFQSMSGPPRTEMSTFESIPRWINPPDSHTTNNLTADEVDVVSNPGTDLPESGISHTCSLVQQHGSGGNGYTTAVDGGFMAVNLIDPENVIRYAAPMMYSYTVKTAESIDLLGETYSALIRTDIATEGVPVTLTVVDENNDQTVHIVRTEQFIAVDSESYAALSVDGDVVEVYDRWTPMEGDPNDLFDTDLYFAYYKPNTSDPNLVDPNDMENPLNFDFVSRLDTSHPNFITDEILHLDRVQPLKLIPIGEEDDYIEIEFTPDAWLILKGAPSWLTDDSVFDMNDDGIVNFGDFY